MHLLERKLHIYRDIKPFKIILCFSILTIHNNYTYPLKFPYCNKSTKKYAVTTCIKAVWLLRQPQFAKCAEALD
jgi:hypothetical protein